MFEFFRSFFNPAPPSRATAKERLRLVLLSDHLSLAPDVMEAMKRDLLEVFSRYVEIDTANADVTFEQREAEVAMLASVPILGIRDRKAPLVPELPAQAPAPPAVPVQAAAPPAVPVQAAERPAVPVQAAERPAVPVQAAERPAVPVQAAELPAVSASETADVEVTAASANRSEYEPELAVGPRSEPAPASQAEAVTESVAKTLQPVRPANAGSSRRRRRKKSAGQNGQQVQPNLGPPGIAASQA